MSKSKTIDTIFHLMHSLKGQLSDNLEAQQAGVVPMQARVLMILHKRENCTANDIVKLIKRDKAQITRLISGLIDQGLLRKEPNPDDLRSQLLVFTSEGERVKNLVLAQVESIQKKITTGLTKQEVEQFEIIPAKMIQNLQPL